MPVHQPTRRKILGTLAGAAVALPGCRSAAPPLRMSTFEADITPPTGTPYLGGVLARSTVDPLYAKGLVFTNDSQPPVVLAALDWCELRNDSYDSWRDALAEAAGTTRERVLLHCVHQHDAPYVDETAQELLKRPACPATCATPRPSPRLAMRWPPLCANQRAFAACDARWNRHRRDVGAGLQPPLRDG
ncbi:MAG: hypothetical protein R2748_11790 [Bryobacterales bacterium]